MTDFNTDYNNTELLDQELTDAELTELSGGNVLDPGFAGVPGIGEFMIKQAIGILFPPIRSAL